MTKMNMEAFKNTLEQCSNQPHIMVLLYINKLIIRSCHPSVAATADVGSRESVLEFSSELTSLGSKKQKGFSPSSVPCQCGGD